MKQYIVLLFVCFNIFPSNLFADSAYQHFSTEELKQANMLIKGMKSNDDTYKKYLEPHKSINEALFLCKHGLSQKLKLLAGNTLTNHRLAENYAGKPPTI